METIGIRQLSGAALRELAEKQKVVGLTSDRILRAVLVPVTQRWVEGLLEQNLSRILTAIERGEKERVDQKPLRSLGDIEAAPQSSETRPRLTPTLRRVSIRDLSGALIEEAAQEKQPLGITDNHVLRAVLLPVSQQWVDRLLGQNLSRILYGIDLAERDSKAGNTYLLEDAFPEEGGNDVPRPQAGQSFSVADQETVRGGVS